jgi:hypothetical protein
MRTGFNEPLQELAIAKTGNCKIQEHMMRNNTPGSQRSSKLIQQSRRLVLSIAVVLLASCGSDPGYIGRFVDPSNSAWVDILEDGSIKNAMGSSMQYKVSTVDANGTTLLVSDSSGWSAQWRVSADGKELHGASSPANVVFRRK